ncbi:hypothetical protein E6W39_16505 [Kitasatospora acidiphila]|uniref:Uncharacterized protein n=1 Tax=Kitasatospora acidiphila TaxID=2567942 RepID=A0A540W3D0_9ACTN|nr:hypothetical protein [Kitasatospora acidiphila]TQF03536.1 hypothetical protein E6W39_16505 [Kitasatospora acidiphila]
MITKLTGQTVVAASLRPSTTAVAGGVSLVAGSLGLSVGTGLSLGWAAGSVDCSRGMRGGRPTEAPKAVDAAAKHGAYLQVIGAVAEQQDEQLINQAKAAFIGAEAARIRAFRGPEPWRERT